MPVRETGVEQQHHHHIEPVKPSFPKLGKGQEQITGIKYTLAQLERMALERPIRRWPKPRRKFVRLKASTCKPDYIRIDVSGSRARN